MESFYEKYKSFNWDDEISSRLTSYRHATKQGEKDTCEWCISYHRCFSLERQKCIEAQQRIIIFGSVRQAENQLTSHHICLTITHQQRNCVIMDRDCSQSQCLSISPLQRIPSLGNTMLKI